MKPILPAQGLRLAVMGKGGSGKSVLAGTMARHLARGGHRVLALDSDPMPGLAISLGMGAVADAMLAEAVEQSDDGRWRLKRGIGAARAVQRYARPGPDGVRLLQFGKAGPDGLASITPSVTGFGQVVGRLARDRVMSDWTIIGDLPAGPRQPAYGWAPYATIALVVVEPTWKSILSARRIARIVRSRPGMSVLYAANQVGGPAETSLLANRLRDEISFAIPLDPRIGESDRLGMALIDHAPSAAATQAIMSMADQLAGRVMA